MKHNEEIPSRTPWSIIIYYTLLYYYLLQQGFTIILCYFDNYYSFITILLFC